MAVKFVIHRRIMIGFVLPSLVLVGAAVLVYQNIAGFRLVRQEVRASRNMLNALQDVLSDADEAETGQRGYIITGDEAYLQPYNRAILEIDAALDHIQALAAGNASQEKLGHELREHTQAKVAELRESVELRRGAHPEAAKKELLSGAGKLEMDKMRELIAAMRTDENRRLETNRQRYEASVANRDRFFAGAIVLLFALLMLLFVFLYRDAKFRARAGLEMLQGNLRLTAILTTMGEGLYQVDRNGSLIYLNPAGEQLLGYAKDEIHGKPIHELIHATAADGSKCAGADCPLISSIARRVSHHSTNDQFRRKDNSSITVEYTCSPLMQYGEANGAVVVFRDVTQRIRMEHALRDNEERYRNLVEKSRGLICTHSMDGTLLSVNEASAEALGYLPEELIGKNMQDFLHPAVKHKFAWYLKALTEWGSHSGLMRVRTKEGEEIVWSYSNRVVEGPGSEAYVLGHAHDVTSQVLTEEALKVSEEKLQAALEKEKNMARVDFLTQIANRRTFYEAVADEAKRSRRYARPMTLVYIDVDNFKQVNDVHGHETGDQLLKMIGQTIRASIRATDMVARLGGDEFAMLLPETSSEAAGVVMAKVQPRLQKAAEEKEWPVTFSVGMVTFSTPLESVDEMIKRADELMYEVKRTGKSALVAQVV